MTTMSGKGTKFRGLTHAHTLAGLGLTVDEEELQEVQDDQQGVEGVEVDVEGVAPLHVKVSARVLQQVLVAEEPGSRDKHGVLWMSGGGVKSEEKTQAEGSGLTT